MTAAAHTDVNDLAQALLECNLDAEPLEGTLMGFREYDDRLADLSLEAERSHANAQHVIRDEAAAIDPGSLTAQDALTRSVILSSVGYADDARFADQLAFTVAAFPVSPASVLLAYLRMIVVTNDDEARAYLARLGSIPAYLEQSTQRLALGRADGVTPVAHLVTMAIEQIEHALAAPASPFSLELPEAFLDEQAILIDEVVNPAFARYAQMLRSEVLPSSRDNDHAGLVHLPGGLARYEALIRVHTTTDRTAAQLHELGLTLVSNIHDEFRALGRQLFGLDDVVEIFARLQSDPDLRWENEGQIIAAAEQTVRRAEAASVEWFGTLPKATCVLETIPELEAASAAPAYYMPPSFDGTRPGTYFTNVNEPTERTSFDLESVAFHEAVPGHHFQISLAMELEDLPTLRKLAGFTAYVEGWGLYSERLADEMGLYSSPLQRMGMLSADAWRAARLVVDTGLHAYGWSRETAIEYLLASAPLAPIDAVAEIDRYIAYPGQALSYMTGRLEIQRLRASAEQALGDAFSIAAFHDVILGSGALPLDVLAELVDEWISRQRA